MWAQLGHTHLCDKSPLWPIMPYFFAILGKVTQLLVVEAPDLGNILQLFFYAEVPLSLGGFLLHFPYWPLFGPLAIYTMLPILTFVVSCETCDIPTFLFMESFSKHSTTFIISWQVVGTSFHCRMASGHESKPPSVHIPFSSKWGLVGMQRFGHTSPSLLAHWISASLLVLAHPLGFGRGGWTSRLI